MFRIIFFIFAAILGLFLAGSIAFFFWYQSQVEGLDPGELEARYASGDRFIQVEGARVRVREEGAPDAPVLFLIHGYTYSLESWDGWAEALSADYRIIRYDLLGHGLTGPDPQERYAPQERADFLGDVMDALGLESASLAGNSLGGLIAWRFAADHPDRVERLILVDAGGFSINGVTDTPVAAAPAVEAYLRLAPEAGVAQAAGFVYADVSALPEGRLTVIRDMMRRRGNGQAFIDHINEFTLPDPRPDLGRIEAETLILWGGRDLLIPVDHADRFNSAIPQSEMVIFENLGHAPHEEDPIRTASAARAFLAGEE